MSPINGYIENNQKRKISVTNLRELPKTEIHSHLDCTLSFEAVNILSPGTSEEEYFAKYVAPQRCTNLAHYLEYTRNCVNLLQSKESLQVAVKDLFDQLADENVIYSEIRFAPHLHTKQGLALEKIVETVEAAVAKAVNEFGIEARIILCTLCHQPEKVSMEVVKLVEKFQESYVAALVAFIEALRRPLIFLLICRNLPIPVSQC